MLPSKGVVWQYLFQSNLPEDVRKRLAQLNLGRQAAIPIAFMGELLSNTRTGFAFVPQKFGSIDQLQRFAVQQLLKILEDDVGSFNRFYDAVQETVTVAVKAMSVFRYLYHLKVQ